MKARDNPFNAQRILAVRYRLDGISWEELLERLAAFGDRAAIVGPHGHGKTTLLEDLAPRLEARGFRVRSITLREGDRRLAGERRATLFRGLSKSDFLLVDGAEQLGRLAWLGLRRRSLAAGGLVVTSHRPGLLPTLYECRTTPELLAALLRRLLGPPGDELRAGEILARHRGNVRDALRELYDLYAERP